MFILTFSLNHSATALAADAHAMKKPRLAQWITPGSMEKEIPN